LTKLPLIVGRSSIFELCDGCIAGAIVVSFWMVFVEGLFVGIAGAFLVGVGIDGFDAVVLVGIGLLTFAGALTLGFDTLGFDWVLAVEEIGASLYTHPAKMKIANINGYIFNIIVVPFFVVSLS
jgi:hypothetical protein